MSMQGRTTADYSTESLSCFSHRQAYVKIYGMLQIALNINRPVSSYPYIPYVKHPKTVYSIHLQYSYKSMWIAVEIYICICISFFCDISGCAMLFLEIPFGYCYDGFCIRPVAEVGLCYIIF